MKLVESLIYALVAFVALYVLISVGLRMFEVTTSFYAHVIGGITGTVVAVSIFIWVLVKSKK